MTKKESYEKDQDDKKKKDEQDPLHFRVSGKITKLLGRESVSEAITALFETLKNSHDADAIGVTINVENIATGATTIRIKEEKADGMTYDEIENKFFVIGTYSKAPTKNEAVRITKRLKRKMLGNKGVGRFSLERLGTKVKIISKPFNTLEKYTFEIDWDRFEPEEITVDQVGINVIPGVREDVKDSGLEIEISNLRDEWDEDMISKLESKIQRLILPKELQPENAFQITMNIPELGINNKLLEVKLSKKAFHSLTAKLFDNRIVIVGKTKGKKVLSSEFETFKPFQSGERLTEKKKSSLKNVSDLTCGPAKLIVYYFPLYQRGSDRQAVVNYYGEAFSNLIDSNLEKFSGVRIFRDGLRAFRYGDPDKDWVERAAITRNYSGTIQSDRLVGYCLISNKTNSQIKETTSREAAIEDQAYLDLREFVIQSMLEFDYHMHKERRKAYEEKHGIKAKKETLGKMKNVRRKLTMPKSRLAKVIDKVKEVYGEDYTQDITLINNVIADAEKIVESQIKEQEQEMTTNQIQLCLASLGDTVSWAYHEANRSIGIVADSIEKLRKHFVGERSRTNEELEKIVKRLIRNWGTSVAWNQYVDTFTSGLTLDQEASITKGDVKPRKIISEMFEDLKILGKVEKISYENNMPESLTLITYGAFLESIFSNLLVNSIKAFNKQDNSNLKENKISIDYEIDELYFTVYFSDNSDFGIPKDLRETVFEPRISSTSKDLIFGGHGMGLTIVREILKNQNGSIEITDPIHARGTTFKIRFPLSIIEKEK